jgi:TonB family protein
MKTNPVETINEAAAVPTLKIHPARLRSGRTMMAAGLLLMILGGATGPIAWGETDQAAALPSADPVYNLSQLDQIPTPRYQAKPIYPPALKQAGVTGEATIGFIVDSAGIARNVNVVKSTHADFATAAVEAVAKWKFNPGQKGGKVVNTRMQVPIVFALPGPSIGSKPKAETN